MESLLRACTHTSVPVSTVLNDGYRMWTAVHRHYGGPLRKEARTMKAEKPLASSFSTSTMLVDVWSSSFRVKCIAGKSSNIWTLPDSRRRWIPTTRTSIACVAVANPLLSTPVPPRIPAPHIGAVLIGAADLPLLVSHYCFYCFWSSMLSYGMGWAGRYTGLSLFQ